MTKIQNRNDGMVEWWNTGMLDLEDWGIGVMGRWNVCRNYNTYMEV
jgi:hypothetical protein